MSEVPASLEQRMQQARAAVAPQDTEAATLAAAAIHALQDALQNCDERSAALPLLAADALVTAACAVADADDLERLAHELAPAQLAALLER